MFSRLGIAIGQYLGAVELVKRGANRGEADQDHIKYRYEKKHTKSQVETQIAP
jgi:hypothetical protein